jgi:hypothetical protein
VLRHFKNLPCSQQYTYRDLFILTPVCQILLYTQLLGGASDEQALQAAILICRILLATGTFAQLTLLHCPPLI